MRPARFHEVVTRLLKEMRQVGIVLRRNGSLAFLDLHR
jgi:hypothetical protein